MCIALYYINPKGKFRFILLFNREEFSKRPTDQLKIILNNQDNIIIAGQDQLQQGTWLGFNITNGMIAFLTNKNHFFYVSFKQKISQITNQIRFQYPKFMKFFYPTFKSRGQLIVDLLKKKNIEQPLEFDYKLKDQHLTCNYHLDNKSNNDNDNCYTKSRLIQAQLNKDQYMGFNLFVGNLINQEYYLLSSTSNQFRIADKSGTACSFSTIGENQIEKEIIAQNKFEQIIETEDNIDILFDKLFQLAQEKFKSNEIFFKAFPEESSFFIPEYKTKIGQKRGTRTTSIIIFDGFKVEMKEKTYL
ncbi:unnamed protein product [Paramecium sonneborni]|uniref:Uncharacterized protein n=1 Tax=Paramecium sonneborni TaxID=65129 RepID=A0A8S1R6C2_9CILI|nr:unnamed protein product [Paramecium sonneborni]